jgi:hypothetical protein
VWSSKDKAFVEERMLSQDDGKGRVEPKLSITAEMLKKCSDGPNGGAGKQGGHVWPGVPKRLLETAIRDYFSVVRRDGGAQDSTVDPDSRARLQKHIVQCLSQVSGDCVDCCYGVTHREHAKPSMAENEDDRALWVNRWHCPETGAPVTVNSLFTVDKSIFDADILKTKGDAVYVTDDVKCCIKINQLL